HSLMSFLSVASSSTTGLMRFDPVNSSTGRMRLLIENAGAVSIFGHTLNPPHNLTSTTPTFTLSDIDLSAPTGGNAQFIVENSAGANASSLQIVNSNTILTEYLQNPFCTDTPFDGAQQYGFILGANGEIQINN